MEILHINDFIWNAGGAEVVIKLVSQKSRHEMHLIDSREVSSKDIRNYDLVHLHNVFYLPSQKSLLRNAKYVMSSHSYIFDCTKQSKFCLALRERKACVLCKGLIKHLYWKVKRMRPLKLVAKNAQAIIVHSKWMQTYYSQWNPVYLPIPLEVEKMTPSKQKEDYIFFSSRASYEKNPLAFARLCDELNVKGVMVLYCLTGGLWFKKYVKKFRNSNVDLYFDLEREKLFDLYRHAKLTVHPYVYAEPFGISSINSVLLGTPLIAYPFGNLKFISTYTAYPFDKLLRIVKHILHNENFYEFLLYRTLRMRKKFLREFDSINLWDNFYEEVVNA